MIKRLLWLASGALMGFTSSFWVGRWIRRRVERVMPERLVRDTASAARRVGADLKAAASEAREAMKEREAALRAEFGDRR